MRRHIILLAALALAVSMGCAKSAPHKMGAAGPPPGRTIPVGYDPSVSGLSGAVGEVVYNNGGLGSWVRFGANATDWQAFPAPSQVEAGYSTGLLDLTVAANNISINIPSRPGFLFVPVTNAGVFLLHDISGTATGPLVYSVGNDVNRVNTMGSTSLAAGTINGVAPGPFPLTSTVGAQNLLSDSGTQIAAKITTGITGVASAHGYIKVTGFWVPL